MMLDKERDEIVRLRIENAWKTLQAAELMKENEFWNSAINRMYYACYYAVSALLIKYGITAQTHAGVRQMFGLHFLRTEKIAQEKGQFYSLLFSQRHSGDYDDFIFFDKKTVDDLYPQTVDFIKAIEKLTNQ